MNIKKIREQFKQALNEVDHPSSSEGAPNANPGSSEPSTPPVVRQDAAAGAVAAVGSAPSRAVPSVDADDDPCPGRPYCLIEFPAWGDGARIIYCRNRDDRFKAKREHRGIPLFLRAELRTLAKATEGETDEEVTHLLQGIYRLKKAGLKSVHADMWVTGFADGALSTGARPPDNVRRPAPPRPPEVKAPLAEYNAVVARLAKAIPWLETEMPKASPKKRAKAEAAFADLLREVADLTERIAASGRKMTTDEVLHGFKEAS